MSRWSLREQKGTREKDSRDRSMADLTKVSERCRRRIGVHPHGTRRPIQTHSTAECCCFLPTGSWSLLARITDQRKSEKVRNQASSARLAVRLASLSVTEGGHEMSILVCRSLSHVQQGRLRKPWTDPLLHKLQCRTSAACTSAQNPHRTINFLPSSLGSPPPLPLAWPDRAACTFVHTSIPKLEYHPEGEKATHRLHGVS